MNQFPFEEKNTEKDIAMLDTVLTIPRLEMPLSVFERDFLPVINPKSQNGEVANEIIKEIERKTGGRHSTRDIVGNILNRWIDYHNTHTAPYLYTDVKDGADIVYTVPPLLSNGEVIVPNVDSAMLTATILHAGDLATVHQNMALQHLNENLKPLIRKPQVNQENIDLWNKIYTYHGMPTVEYVDGTLKPLEKTETVIKKNGVTYDASGAISDMDEYD